MKTITTFIYVLACLWYCFYGNEQKSVVEPLADDAPITEWMARRPFLMGQAAGAIDNVLPAKDIVHEMVSTAVEHLNMASKYVVSKM